MPSKKSSIACRFSIETLAGKLPNLYMWTFTWAEVKAVTEAKKLWNRFVHDPDGWVAAFPYMSGIRVFEIHPGADPFVPDLSHGLHVHALIDKRIPVDIVRSIWTRKGGGRLHVLRIPAEKAMYIGKYLSKSRIECLEGTRLWGPIGRSHTHKVKDIVVDSRWTATYQWMATIIHDFDKLRWDQRARLVTSFVFTDSLELSLQSIGMSESWESTPEQHEHHHLSLEVHP